MNIYITQQAKFPTLSQANYTTYLMPLGYFTNGVDFTISQTAHEDYVLFTPIDLTLQVMPIHLAFFLISREFTVNLQCPHDSEIILMLVSSSCRLNLHVQN